MRSSEDRYRTLLDASSALADQPTVKAVLHSLREVLSSTSRLNGTELYVLDDDEQSLHVLEFDRDPDAPAFKIGTKVSRIGAAARVLEEQKPVFIRDTSQEMMKHPELAPFAVLFVPSLCRPETIRFSCRDQVAGRGIHPRRCRTTPFSGVARCGRARMRTGKRQRRALPATSGERAGSTQAVAGDQQSHRFQAGH